MTELELTTNKGLESFVLDEWHVRSAPLAAAGGGLTPGAALARVRVWADAPEEAVVAAALQMRTIHHVLRMLHEFELPDTLSDPLAFIRSQLALLSIRELDPEGTSFRVTTERTGVHSFTSIDVQRAAGAGILDRYERPVRMKGHDVEVRCDVRLQRVKVSVQYTRRSLTQRHVRPFRPRTALKANLAWAMLTLARPPHLPPPRALLDPCCGSGTVLLEAAERWSDCFLAASDTSEMCVRGVQQNLKAEPAAVQVHTRQGDARLLDRVWEGQKFDTVVANLPFGLRLGAQMHPYWFLVDLLGALARAMDPGGRVVLLTTQRRALNLAAEQGGHFRVRFARVVEMGGVHPGMMLLERTDRPAVPPRARLLEQMEPTPAAGPLTSA
ncbi:MAG: hypothetical protein CL927_13740 [Deltaproteobacteria bacterium]|nr:hypothetical protein [Deltaproteobacteria bacterium]HCH61258.1 hypothetical protein [Deltaproteobacteria bacterium]